MKKFMIFLVFTIILASFISAGIPIHVIPLDVSGNIQPSTSFLYKFDFTRDSGCTSILLTNTSTIITNKNGVGFIDISISSLSEAPKYLCEYKDGSLRKVHTLSSETFTNIFTSDISSADWTNVTIIESQISDLTHTIDTDTWFSNYTFYYDKTQVDNNFSFYMLLTDQRYNETQAVLDNNASWLSTYNSTYDSLVSDNSSWNEIYADGKYAKYNFGSNNFDGIGYMSSGGLNVSGRTFLNGNSIFNISSTDGYCENESCTELGEGYCEAPIFVPGACASVWHDASYETINITNGDTVLAYFPGSGGLHMNSGIRVGSENYEIDEVGLGIHVDNEINGQENFNTGIEAYLLNANSSFTIKGIAGQIYPANKSEYVINMYGLNFLVAFGLTGFPVYTNVTNVYGSKSRVSFNNYATGGHADDVYGSHVSVGGLSFVDSPTIDSVYGMFIDNDIAVIQPEKVGNSYGLYISPMGGSNNTYSVFTNSGRVRFGDNVSVDGNVSATGYMFATDFLTGSKVADVKNGEKSLSKLSNIDKWLKSDGSINYSAHYAGTTVSVEDKSRPVIVPSTKPKPECENDPYIELKYKTQKEYEENCLYAVNMTTYPYNKEKDALSMETRVSEMEKMIYELDEENNMLKEELCKKDKTYSWC